MDYLELDPLIYYVELSNTVHTTSNKTDENCVSISYEPINFACAHFSSLQLCVCATKNILNSCVTSELVIDESEVVLNKGFFNLQGFTHL